MTTQTTQLVMTFESQSQDEADELHAALAAACSERVQFLRSAGDGQYHLCAQLGEPCDAQFQADLAALLTTAGAVVHRLDPGGHWLLTRVPGEIAATYAGESEK